MSETEDHSPPSGGPTADRRRGSDNRNTRAQAAQWLLRVGVQCLALLLTFVVGTVLVGAAQRIGWIRGHAAPQHAAQEAATDGAKFICPMHPEIRQDDPGTCPKCGMDLEPIETSSTGGAEASSAPPTSGDDRYICPMMCTPAQSEPGKCPVCAMDLVKAGNGGNGGGERGVSIDAAARRILGIRTAVAEHKEVYRQIHTVGEIAYDEQRVATIAAYVDGRLEELFADYVGVEVAQGDSLAVLYSPQLYSAQAGYLSSLNTPSLNALAGDNDSLSETARDNLSELGMTAEQIDALRSSRKPQKRLRIASPIGGTVIAKHRVEGDYVKTGEPIYRVADLSTVWLMLDLYPSDAAAVRFGQQVEAEVQSLPGEVYTGRVAFEDPTVNKQTRTVTVRVEMTNFDGRLKPGDYATAAIRVPAVPFEEIYDPALAGKWISPMHPQIIRSQPGQCPICGMELTPTSDLGYADHPLPEQMSLVVPRSAVLMAGDHSVVYAETKPGVFELRQVTIASLTENEAVIQAGLEAGEVVATDGNFLIDSQMQLIGNPSLMDPSRSERTGDSPSPGATHAH